MILFLLLDHIRVTTSQKAIKIDFPDIAKIVTKILSNNARVLSVLEDFLSLDCGQNCVE